LSIVKNGRRLSLDFDTDSIKAVVGKNSKKGVIIEKSFQLDLPEGSYKDGEISDIDQLSYLLTSGLSMNGISQIETNAVINSSKIIMREVTFPRVSKEEIEGIINYQLEEYIPINPEDYVVQYLNIGTRIEDGIEKLLLMLIGIPRSMILSHMTVLRNSNLKPEVLDYQGNSISKLISYGGMINETYPSAKTIALLDIGAESSYISIVAEGSIRISRVIEGGLNQILESVAASNGGTNESAIEEYLLSVEDISKKSSDDNHAASVVQSFKESLYGILDKIEMIFRYYKTREVSNEINLLLLHGKISRINGIEKLFRDFYDIDAVILKSLENIQMKNELNIYANAVGGLIRLNEVKK
jgi:type IV pilus assembly protein PilM